MTAHAKMSHLLRMCVYQSTLWLNIRRPIARLFVCSCSCVRACVCVRVCVCACVGLSIYIFLVCG